MWDNSVTSWDSSVSILTRLWLVQLKIWYNLWQGKRFISCPKQPGWFIYPSGFLFSRCQRLLVGRKVRQVVKLTTHLHLVLRLNRNEVVPSFPICLHGVYRDSFTFTIMSRIGLGYIFFTSLSWTSSTDWCRWFTQSYSFFTKSDFFFFLL